MNTIYHSPIICQDTRLGLCNKKRKGNISRRRFPPVLYIKVWFVAYMFMPPQQWIT